MNTLTRQEDLLSKALKESAGNFSNPKIATYISHTILPDGTRITYKNKTNETKRY